MKRLLACVSLIAATTTAATSATPAKTDKHAPEAAAKSARVQKAKIHVAPADEYFGKLKISVLGIRNTIKDVGLNVDVDPARWNGMVNKVAFAEDAMHDWQRKYPQDTWLAKTIFALERMYAKIDTDEGRKRSVATMNWLVHDFPATYYGKLGKREIAQHRVGHPVTATAAQPVPASAAPDVRNAALTVPNTTPTLIPAPAAPAPAVPAPSAAPVALPTPAAKDRPAPQPTLSPAELKTVTNGAPGAAPVPSPSASAAGIAPGAPVK